MPDIIFEIVIMIAQLIRFIALAAFGVAFGWFALDLLKKTTLWQVQIAIYLGLISLVIAMTIYLGIGALGAFVGGLAAAILIWGLPKKPKEEK